MTSAAAILASASVSGCADDAVDTASSATGGGSPTSSSTSSSGSTSGSPTGSTSTGQGGQGGDSSGPGGGLGGQNQGGFGGQNQGGAGSTGTGLGGAGGQGSTGLGGAGSTGTGLGGAGQGGAGQGGGQACGGDLECDDTFSCTVDTCVAGFCQNAPVDLACDDGAFCNGAELCDPANGEAVTGCAVSAGGACDDAVDCTTDVCDEVNDACEFTPVDAQCDNGASCDGAETCSATLGCLAGAPLDCDDGVGCTADFCDLGSDACANVPSDVACSDGTFCNGAEVCDAVADCQPGTAPDCDDGLGCTADSCDENANTCARATNDAACSNGNACDGAETCSATLGCVGGAPLVCSDGIACTQNTCNPATGCVYIPNDATCDDGSDCDGTDVCNPAVGCQGGTPVDCQDDGIACTIESCDELTLGCNSVPDNGACQPGFFCIPAQGQANGGCVIGDPCPGGDADCDDGDLCNGEESCVNGLCSPGVEVVCNDGIDCTFDGCDPGTGQCEVFPSNQDCSDDTLCNGAETCQVGVGCVAGQAVVCADAAACTTDSCDPASGACSFQPNHALCSDGNVCDGAEQCTSNGCVEGAALVCPSDGIACTADSCVPGQGCTSVPNDALCPCTQTCSTTAGCGNFCQVGQCQGKVYECGDCLDNDGDCRVDSSDTQCLGTCDNTENSLYGGIPGQNNSPCKSDCYFDQDTGAGNDECYWSHKCDPLEVAPNFPPEGSQCAYNPNSNIPGYNGSCEDAFNTQSQECADYCGPLTPNGCDCFGCCEIPGAATTVWLGSTVNGNGSCTLANVGNPALCKPCTQVAACDNDCDVCEICIGKPTLPPECNGTQQCPAGIQACGQAGQATCPNGEYCVTGCCQPVAD